MTTPTGVRTLNSHITRSSAQGVIAGLLLLSSSVCFAQRDPGIRGGPPGAGKPLDGLTTIELSMFKEALQSAIQLEAVCDDCTDLTPGETLDPAKANVLTHANTSRLWTSLHGD